ncbi:rod-binding protein [Neorhizobium sp. NCHU2750]|uniref:rod-binding protein n=1 Tax=Neorhizobium sp. NCHU2750 TaxID=1825976 RepID=UPI000E76648A|nr:rod-binding protein [Neorhizobium sp. NCHU2750]
MAISPPSDLVLDVVKAADPDSMMAARDKLRTASASNQAAVLTASNDGFASMLGSTGSDTMKAGLGNAHHGSTEKIPETYRKFEASILSTFFKEMMPKDSEAVYGKGTAGDFWKGMMAEQMADSVSKQGGLGIAQQVFQQALNKQKLEAPTATPDQKNHDMALNMITDIERRALISPQTGTDKTDNDAA